MPPEGSEAIEMSAQPVSEPQLERTQHDSFRIETPANARIQRRKRTSPRDHARLESAYQRNSKPDKEERAALVQHTELTEKEVQVNLTGLTFCLTNVCRYGFRIGDKMTGERQNLYSRTN